MPLFALPIQLLPVLPFLIVSVLVVPFGMLPLAADFSESLPVASCSSLGCLRRAPRFGRTLWMPRDRPRHQGVSSNRPSWCWLRQRPRWPSRPSP
jgi:hypothetical protein